MRMNVLRYAKVLFFIVILSSCGRMSSESDNSDGGKPNRNGEVNDTQPVNRVNWSAVPATFNPHTEDFRFQSEGVRKIEVDAFGFKDDVEVVYYQDVSTESGFLRIFRVFNKSASWGELKSSVTGNKLSIKNYGQYQCSIKVSNGQIESLEGGCYVRLQVFLPTGSEIEVSNVGQLISKRFHPVETEEFLQQFDKATWTEDKFAVIDSFLASYQGLARKPSLTTSQLGVVLEDLIKKDDKLKALEKLHTWISDRENLGKVIDEKFSFFDRDEARRTAGL